MSAFAAWLVTVALAAGEPRFETVEVYVDPAGQALAAYQLEVVDRAGAARVVGVEGGEHPAFEDPPYYDPLALQHEDVVLAAFHVGDDVPREETRVATIHYAVTSGAEPQFEVRLQVAASPSGLEVPAQVRIAQGGESE